MSIIQGNSKVSAGGYEIDQSIRFNSSDSAYLTRTPTSTGDQKKWTTSFWFKRCKTGGPNDYLMTAGQTGTNNGVCAIYIQSDDTIHTYFDTTGANPAGSVNPRKFRDPSAWYHFIWAVDAVNTVQRIWVNGEELSLNASRNPPNFAYDMNASGSSKRMSFATQAWGHATFANIYAAEIHHLDGQYITDPTTFGEYDDNGVWRPIEVTGLTYGTNGFYITGENSADLGEDFSGNNNDFTSSGLTSDDQVTDTPTENYATFSSINVDAVTLSNGNLFCASAGYWSGAAATMTLPNSGKWYIETLVGNRFGSYMAQGFVPNDGSLITSAAQAIYYGSQDSGTTPNYGLGMSRGNKFGFYAATGTTTAAVTEPDGSTLYSTNEIYICHALDLDNQRYWVGTAFVGDSSVTWFGPSGSGADPETPSTGLDISAYLAIYGDYGLTFFHAPNKTSGNPYATVDFGQSGFTFTKPTSFSALSTANLPTPAIKDGSKYFQTTTYTGAGYPTEVNQSGNSTFQPDFVWIKRRNAATTHDLFDAVRGVSSQLYSNLTNAEGTVSNAISFDADGFTAAADPITGDTGSSGNTFVGWQWLAGNGTASNTNGSITSTVSANTTAYFSISTYTGTGSNATVGHGLGSAPSMVIVKNRTTAGYSWKTYHEAVGATYHGSLNATTAFNTTGGSTIWNNTAPTSSVFSVGTSTQVNGSANNYVAYCFAEVEGFSKFGSYTGNGSSNGSFIFTGFKPAWVMTKRTNSTGAWTIFDNQREGYNVDNDELVANTTAAETTTNYLDLLSNGFKLRSTDGDLNASGSTYIYMAFAEHPFGGDGVAPVPAR
jgi:hypothetical protein